MTSVPQHRTLLIGLAARLALGSTLLAMGGCSAKGQPATPADWVALASVQAEVLRFDDAIESLELALAKQDDYYPALWRLANLTRDHKRRYRKAWELSVRALKARPDGTKALQSQCATSLVGGGPPVHAADLLIRCKRAVEGDTSLNARLLYARALHYSGDVTAAAKLYSDLVAQAPADLAVKGHYIGLLGKTGRIPEAVALQRELLAAAPTDEQQQKNMVGLLFMLADGQLRMGSSDKACATATEAYQINQAPEVAKRVRTHCGRVPPTPAGGQGAP